MLYIFGIAFWTRITCAWNWVHFQNFLKNPWLSPHPITHSHKGNRRRSIGYCPHLWKSPLQPFQPAQQSPWLWDNYNEPVFQCCGVFGDASSIASRTPISNFASWGIPTANLDETRFWMSNALGHNSLLKGILVPKLQHVNIECWPNVLRSIRGIEVKVKVPYFQGQSWWHFINEDCLRKVPKLNRKRISHILPILWVSVATMHIRIWWLGNVTFFHKP